MKQDAINAALSAELKTLAPALPIAWPNEVFNPPASTPYIRAFFLPTPTQDVALGTGSLGLKRMSGIFQVSLYYPLNTGEGDSRRKADAVIALFPRGKTLTHGGVDVVVDATPYASPAFVSDAWYVTPVTIEYRADVY